MTEVYTADDIKVLTGLDVVRRRPGMYVGDTSDPDLTTKLFFMSLCHAIHENCTQLKMTVALNKTSIWYDKALPLNKDRGEIQALSIFKAIHCRSAFHDGELAILNALCQRLRVSTSDGQYQASFIFDQGTLRSPITIEKNFKLEYTEVSFKLDGEILPDPAFKFDQLKKEIEILKIRHPEISISVTYDYID